jgi:hypothetical protein
MSLNVTSPATWRLPPELTKAMLSFLPADAEDSADQYYGSICSSMLVCKDWKVSASEIFSEALSGY